MKLHLKIVGEHIFMHLNKKNSSFNFLTNSLKVLVNIFCIN